MYVYFIEKGNAAQEDFPFSRPVFQELMITTTAAIITWIQCCDSSYNNTCTTRIEKDDYYINGR